RDSSPHTTPAANMTTIPPRPVRVTGLAAAVAPAERGRGDEARRPRMEPPGDAPSGASRTDDEVTATSLADQAALSARGWPARRNLPVPWPGHHRSDSRLPSPRL